MQEGRLVKAQGSKWKYVWPMPSQKEALGISMTYDMKQDINLL